MRTEFIHSLDFDVVPLLGFDNRKKHYPVKFNPARMWRDLDRYQGNASALSAYMHRKWITVQFLRQEHESMDSLMVVAGEFVPDHEARSGAIYDDVRVVVFASRDQFNRFDWSIMSWETFKFLFIRTALHEIIHARQFANGKRKWRVNHISHTRSKSISVQNQRHYLSDIYEIDAYAHCCFYELKAAYKNFDFRQLSDRLSASIKSHSLKYYLRVFGYRGARDKLVIKRLVARIRVWERVYRHHGHLV